MLKTEELNLLLLKQKNKGLITIKKTIHYEWFFLCVFNKFLFPV